MITQDIFSKLNSYITRKDCQQYLIENFNKEKKSLHLLLLETHLPDNVAWSLMQVILKTSWEEASFFLYRLILEKRPFGQDLLNNINELVSQNHETLQESVANRLQHENLTNTCNLLHKYNAFYVMEDNSKALLYIEFPDKERNHYGFLTSNDNWQTIECLAYCGHVNNTDKIIANYNTNNNSSLIALDKTLLALKKTTSYSEEFAKEVLNFLHESDHIENQIQESDTY